MEGNRIDVMTKNVTEIVTTHFKSTQIFYDRRWKISIFTNSIQLRKKISIKMMLCAILFYKVEKL